MNSEYSRAGELGSEIIDQVHKFLKPGKSLLEIADEIENSILSAGGQLAFPVSIAVNDVAAHYAPLYGDETTLPSDALVKVDLGVHFDGYICDCARTIPLGDYPKNLYNASLEALKLARDILKPGLTLSEFGSQIQEVIESHSVKPIYNLTGHLMDQYIIHAGISIPNVSNNSSKTFKPGMAVAIEPFATNGSSGYIIDRGSPCIYAFRGYKIVRNPAARKLMTEYYSKRKTLPFAQRWVVRDYGKLKSSTAIRFLRSDNLLMEYPPLVEESGGWVSQFEASFFITENGAEVIGGPKEVLG